MYWWGSIIIIIGLQKNVQLAITVLLYSQTSFTMAAWSDGAILWWLLLLLLPTLLLAQDDCSHNCKTEANRYYYVRPKGSAETLCPAQPCLTPSQLREHFSECEHNNSCQTANTSLVLLPGTYTLASTHGSIIPQLKFFSLIGYNEDCNTDSLATPSIDCNGTWISLMFQRIKCLHVRNCVVFTGHGTNVEVDRVTFHDSLIQLASITAADHSELDYNYTLGSQSYCLLQKQLSDINALVPSNSVLALRNVSFSSILHSACTRKYGIQLASIRATGSALDIADCLFTQNAITHLSLLHSTLRTSGMVQFENANTAIKVNSSFIHLAGAVNFFNNNMSAIQAVGTHSTILLAGTAEFANNTAYHGGAIFVMRGNMTIADNAHVVFQGNSAKMLGGAISSVHHVTIAGTVQFINNSATSSSGSGGGICCFGKVTIANNAQAVFQGNRADYSGGSIFSSRVVTIAGSVQFINNSAYQGGAIYSKCCVTIDSHNPQVESNTAHGGGPFVSNQHSTIAGSVQFINNSANRGGAISSVNMTIAENAQIVFQDNHADDLGGAISSSQLVNIEGTVQYINNSAYQGGAIGSEGFVTIANNAQVIFQDNHASDLGGAISSTQHVAIAGAVQFICNSANQGGAIDSKATVTLANNAQVVFQGNHAKQLGGAIASGQHVVMADTMLIQFANNTASIGGGIGCFGKVTLGYRTQAVFQDNHADKLGGAIYSHQHSTVAGSVQFINNSAFQGGAIDSSGGMTIAANVQVDLNNHVLFIGNHAVLGGGALVALALTTIAGSVRFINNSANHGGAISSVTVTIADNSQLVFQDNHADNVGGAIWSSQLVSIAGSVQLINNSAYQGGAIDSNSYVTIANNAEVLFIGNHAFLIAEVVFQGNHAYHVGGAICSSGSIFVYYKRENCSISFGINSTMDLLHNTAERGGSAMYGMTMSKLICQPILDDGYEYLYDIITIIPDSFSAVSSDPQRVCICPDQSTPDCLAILPDQNIPHLHYTVYPGQNFTIPAAVVGFNFALTSGSVYTQFLSSDASLGSDTQYVQGVNQTGCSQLQFSVLSGKKQETLVLTTNGRQVWDIDSSIEEEVRIQKYNYVPRLTSFSNPKKYYVNSTFVTNLTDGAFRLAGLVLEPLQHTPVFVSVQLLDCPPGFTLTGQQRCGCNEKILKNLLICNINNQTVRRHGNIWVNATFSENTLSTNGVIVHKHCPFEYCKPEQLDINLTHPETQCAFDHYGTLCGACKPNFSLALGGSQCLPNCSSKNLSLLIVLIVAGFALVFFIKILNLTVSQGTLNGLIFYANIVAANKSIFFTEQYNKMLQFLSVFISWLNLDLGIEICFIKGLDGYWKTWLQFMFPFYVWLIAAAIILVSHYSTRATKIFGHNSVSVLATLLLFSYAKLLRSIINVFSFTTLEYPNNITAIVWSFDGNIQYLSSKHIPLFLFALITLLLLWLPYTAVLLSARWLRTQTHHKGLRWLKPFLDAYYGPFKDKHHYWVGVLLVVRGVLYVFFASFFAIENNVNLLLISITSLAIPIYTSLAGKLYKKMYATVLENVCFLNLGVLGIGTFYIRLVGGNQEALVTTSIGIAFLEFCGITIFHTYQFVIIPIQQWYVKTRVNNGSIDNTIQLQPLPLHNSDSSSDDDSLEYMTRNEVTHSEICLSELCEENQNPPNPTSTAGYQFPPACVVNSTQSGEILIPFNHHTSLSNTQ